MKLAVALSLAMAVLAGPATAQTLAPCDQLAAAARRVTPAKWRAAAKGWPSKIKALAPLLVIDAEHQPTPAEKRFANRPEVRKALGDEGDEPWTKFVDRLRGTDIHMVYEVQGTLDCQTPVFLEARNGRSPRIIASPPQYTELCFVDSAAFGLSAGRPAFIEFGADDPAVSDDEAVLDHALDGSWMGRLLPPRARIQLGIYLRTKLLWRPGCVPRKQKDRPRRGGRLRPSA